MKELISFLEEQLNSIKEKIRKVEEAMEQLIVSSSFLYTNYLLLKSIKGISIINTFLLLCVTVNFQRFDNPKKFACYCEITPFEHSPGISIRRKSQISSLANKEVKVYLTRTANTIFTCDLKWENCRDTKRDSICNIGCIYRKGRITSKTS